MGRHFAVSVLYLVLGMALIGCGQRHQIVYTADKPVPRPKPEVTSRVAVVSASDAPVYKRVATQLLKRHPNASLFDVRDGQRRSAVASVVGREEYDRIAAVGLPALLAVKDLPDKHIVFSKVFNYAEYLTLSDRVYSVSLLPDPHAVFTRWKRVSPELSQVAVVTGKGHKVLLDEIESAGQALGITVHRYVVKNDKELAYVSKNLPLDVGGQWLLPDNRITSRDALREVMGNAVRVGRQVVAFDQSLLELGALASIAVADDTTADLQWQALKSIESSAPRQIMWFPEAFSFDVSKAALKRLGLTSSKTRATE